MTFKNKIVIITGAANGIGHATALAFLDKGAIVYGLDITSIKISHDKFHFIPCDVSNHTQVKASVSHIMQKEGRIDVVVPNAARHAVATLEDSTLDMIDELINVNIKGVLYLLKCTLPQLRAQASGAIVMVGSDQCFVGKTQSAIYGLTKGAIAQLTKSTALDYAPYHIRVNAVCPGPIDTPLLDRIAETMAAQEGITSSAMKTKFIASQPIPRVGAPEEVAKVILFLASSDASFMTGTLVSVDGGVIAQ